MTSSDFRKYLQSNNVYFVMSHNGALRRRDVSVRDCLFVVRQALSLGLGVAIINEIEWRDSKVSLICLIVCMPVYLIELYSTDNNKSYPSKSTLS